VSAVVPSLAQAAQVSVSAVCRTLDVPRSTFYARRAHQPSERELGELRLDVELKVVYAQYGGKYGSPRAHRELRGKGIRVGRKRVERRMRALGLVARRPRPYRRTTEADPSHAPAPNLLRRRFNWAQPNKAWVGDITYVRTRSGWAYLAILVDLCTRKVVGWATSTRCDHDLALAALDRAVARAAPPKGLLHHTDRGSTYTAKAYRKRLKQLGMTASMSRKGNCWDNAVAESTISSIKLELLDGWMPAGERDLQHALFDYVERFYNRVRLHSAIGYRTPAARESDFNHVGALVA